MILTNSKSFISWILFSTLALIYGSAFILMKWGLISYSPLQIASYRIFIGAIVLTPLAISVRRFRFSKKQWYFLIQSGILGSLIPAFLFASAEQHLDSSIAGVLGSMTPVFTLLISHFAFNYKLEKHQIPGLILAFGSTLLMGFSTSSEMEFQWKGIIYILIATMCYALNMNFIKYKLQDISPKIISSISLLFLIIPTGLVLFYTDFHTGVNDPENLKSILSITILGITSTAIALLLFIKLLKIASPVFTSSITFAIPFVAIFWGVLDGEKIELFESLIMTLMLLGIWLISKK